MMGSYYFRICQKMSVQIYSYSYLPNFVDPNIFVFVFGPENCICHTLISQLVSSQKSLSWPPPPIVRNHWLKFCTFIFNKVLHSFILIARGPCPIVRKPCFMMCFMRTGSLICRCSSFLQCPKTGCSPPSSCCLPHVPPSAALPSLSSPCHQLLRDAGGTLLPWWELVEGPSSSRPCNQYSVLQHATPLSGWSPPDSSATLCLSPPSRPTPALPRT